MICMYCGMELEKSEICRCCRGRIAGLEISARNKIASRNKEVTLGDYFTHNATGNRFVCVSITHRDNYPSTRKIVIEITPENMVEE